LEFGKWQKNVSVVRQEKSRRAKSASQRERHSDTTGEKQENEGREDYRRGMEKMYFSIFCIFQQSFIF
jgi:hypothetical protein